MKKHNVSGKAESTRVKWMSHRQNPWVQSDPLSYLEDFLTMQYSYDGVSKRMGVTNKEAYASIQESTTARKANNIWVNETNVAFMSDVIRNICGVPTHGLCHGVRNGAEVIWFRKHTKAHVIGTEYTSLALQYPDLMVRADFHEPHPDWTGKMNFIYSNSLDHAIDPKKAMNTWVDQLVPGGIILLEHSGMHEGYATRKDPFSAYIEFMPFLISRWVGRKAYVYDMINLPMGHKRTKLVAILIRKRM